MDLLTFMVTNVCPKAPPGMGQWDDQILGWVKWGTLALIMISGFVSIAAIVLARVFAHPHGSRMGAMGLAMFSARSCSWPSTPSSRASPGRAADATPPEDHG